MRLTICSWLGYASPVKDNEQLCWDHLHTTAYLLLLWSFTTYQEPSKVQEAMARGGTMPTPPPAAPHFLPPQATQGSCYWFTSEAHTSGLACRALLN